MFLPQHQAIDAAGETNGLEAMNSSKLHEFAARSGLLTYKCPTAAEVKFDTSHSHCTADFGPFQ